MKIYLTEAGIIVEKESQFFLAPGKDFDKFINDDNLFESCEEVISIGRKLDATSIEQRKKPMGSQELWACGVTYLRSRDGRQEESLHAGGGDFYAKVYEAQRPEVFFKAAGHRIVGDQELVNIRRDSSWDVPEPELTLVVTSSGRIVGFTIGNDMSSRSIEGENPLYLPQAKTYDGCAAIGPCILVTKNNPPASALITMTISRNHERVFYGEVTLGQMKRTPEELVSFVYRACSFPQGCFIMTGTGIVPPADFTLATGDHVSISIEGIGILNNTVGKKI